MHELVIISGKGGTGKTSVTASFALLAERPVIADCDVDAADLHLLLEPELLQRNEFRSGHKAVIRQEDCSGCQSCLTHCRYGAVVSQNNGEPEGMYYVPAGTCNDCDYCQRSCSVKANEMLELMGGVTGKAILSIDPIACDGCGVCVQVCPEKAIDFPEQVVGEWYVSKTCHHPMVHARLGIAAENSGKLVSTVRQEARRIAKEESRSTILVDGPPGIGCPVIASITGASLLLVVTEPTVSGKHDLERVLSLAGHFRIPAAVCINKWDLNPGMSEAIESEAQARGAAIAGRIRYDPEVIRAQVQARPPVDYACAAAKDIRELWENFRRIGAEHGIAF